MLQKEFGYFVCQLTPKESLENDLNVLVNREVWLISFNNSEKNHILLCSHDTTKQWQQ